MNYHRERIEIPEEFSGFGGDRPNPARPLFLKSASNLTFPSLLKLVTDQKYVFTPAFVSIVLTLFGSHIAHVIQNMAAERIATNTSDWENTVTILNRGLMLTRLEEQDLSFWRLFFETQTFEIFETELTERFEKARKVEPSTTVMVST
jgi:hypothetical protein